MEIPTQENITSLHHLPHIPEVNRSNRRSMSSIVLNTRFGLRTYTIRPESPRTKQALIELGMDKQDYHLK